MRVKNVLHLGVKELWSLARDPVMLLLIVFAFTASIYSTASALPDSLYKAPITIVDEDQSVLSQRIIDAYSVKPIDAATLRAAGERMVTVEDHWAEGGLGEAVLAAVADADERPRVATLAVREMPHSGKPAELLAAAGIDADAIAEAARRLVREYARA